jgi:hypothetical protein
MRRDEGGQMLVEPRTGFIIEGPVFGLKKVQSLH